MEQFHHFGTVLVKEDRETGKLVQIAEAAAFVYATKSQRATRQSLTLLSRDKVAHSCDKIA